MITVTLTEDQARRAVAALEDFTELVDRTGTGDEFPEADNADVIAAISAAQPPMIKGKLTDEEAQRLGREYPA